MQGVRRVPYGCQRLLEAIGIFADLVGVGAAVEPMHRIEANSVVIL